MFGVSEVIQFDKSKRSVDELLAECKAAEFDQVLVIARKGESWFTWSSEIPPGRMFATIGAIAAAQRDALETLDK